MSNWTHPQCDVCWIAEWGDSRQPYRFRAEARELETCCICGRQTRSGIYVRRDPAELAHCGGHDE